MSASIDTTEFKAALKKIVEKAIPEAKKKALFGSGVAMIKLAQTESPNVPLDTGNLRGSWGIYTDNDTELAPDPKDHPAPSSYPVEKNEVVIGFFAPYAATRDHSGRASAKDPGAGPGYFAGKIPKLMKIAPRIIATEIANELRKQLS